jgi:hypothetical protein
MWTKLSETRRQGRKTLSLPHEGISCPCPLVPEGNARGLRIGVKKKPKSPNAIKKN